MLCCTFLSPVLVPHTLTSFYTGVFPLIIICSLFVLTVIMYTERKPDCGPGLGVWPPETDTEEGRRDTSS